MFLFPMNVPGIPIPSSPLCKPLTWSLKRKGQIRHTLAPFSLAFSRISFISPPMLNSFSRFLLHVRVSKCLFNASLRAKPFPHKEQILGNIGRCALSCLLRSLERRNTRSHLPQGNFLAPASSSTDVLTFRSSLPEFSGPSDLLLFFDPGFSPCGALSVPDRLSTLFSN